ncbi:MAG TPA: alpha/beta fold hydrolase [Solimonas sp.]|nr:alpha/beta fold hydrolase [Solimonas sp.]
MASLTAVQTFHTLAGHLMPELAVRSARRLLMRPRLLPPRDWEKPALEQAQRIHFRFGLSGLRWGRSGDPVVLMLHGWEGRASQFGRFVAPLLAARRQVIALDAPAHGDSPGEEANPVVFALALMEAAAEIRGLEAVVGHSMGAGALAYALSIGLQVERVVLLGGPSTLRGVLHRFARHIGLPHATRDRFFHHVENYTGVPVDDLDLVRAAARLQTAALIVHDRKDSMVPFSDGEAIAAAWPQAEFMQTEGLGHWRILTDEAVVRRVLRFLAPESALLPARAA